MLRMLAILAPIALAVPCLGQTQVLDDNDQWVAPAGVAPGSPEGRLQIVREALAGGEYARAQKLADAWLESFPASGLRARCLLARGDAIWKGGNEYDALFDYEEVARRYPSSDVFVLALQREYTIACAYADGLKRRWFGTLRIVDATDEAVEMLIRIQERLPGSQLAEQSGMRLADHYFDTRQLDMAAEAYDLFVQNYPRSPQIDKARLRLIYSYCASFRGPAHSAKGLVEAQIRLRELEVRAPMLANRIGAEALLVRIDESEARKLLMEARWYIAQDDLVGAERFIRRLVTRFPRSVSTLEVLDIAPELAEKLPVHAKAGAPDYASLRTAMRAALEPLGGGLTSPAGEPVPAVPNAASTTAEPAKAAAP
ncbi:MAG: outer membrane protein assembly factor BamD [Planctomycetes bacterium]|nr:outer membrane protein assembly factor BamD [Planctomycetota bacterium]